MAEFIIQLFLSVAPPILAQTATDAAVLNTSKPLKIDILLNQPGSECAGQANDEIVVCGEKTDQERYRLRQTKDDILFEEESNRAEFSISENTKIAAENEAAQIGPGVQSNRIMARIKFKF